MSKTSKIRLTNGKTTIVDADDYKKLSKYKWRFFTMKSGNKAYRLENGKPVYMHREIMNAPRGLDVDHINHNTLDNRKSNLRVVTRQENLFNTRLMSHNTSGYKGVSWHKRDKVWQTTIKTNQNTQWIGSFKNKISAALAYDMAVYQLHGEFAWTNFGVRDGKFNLLKNSNE